MKCTSRQVAEQSRKRRAVFVPSDQRKGLARSLPPCAAPARRPPPRAHLHPNELARRGAGRRVKEQLLPQLGLAATRCTRSRGRAESLGRPCPTHQSIDQWPSSRSRDCLAWPRAANAPAPSAGSLLLLHHGFCAGFFAMARLLSFACFLVATLDSLWPLTLPAPLQPLLACAAL